VYARLINKQASKIVINLHSEKLYDTVAFLHIEIVSVIVNIEFAIYVHNKVY